MEKLLSLKEIPRFWEEDIHRKVVMGMIGHINLFLKTWSYSMTPPPPLMQDQTCDMIKGNESHVSKFQFLLFNNNYLSISNTTFWPKPLLNWTSGCTSYRL